MQTKIFLSFILIIFIIFITTLIIKKINSKKISKLIEKSSEINFKFEELSMDFTRLSIISKNSEMIETYEKYNSLFNEYKEDFIDIKNDIDNIKTANKVIKSGKIGKEYKVLIADLNHLETQIDELDVNIQKINDFEKTNQEIYIQLKEKVKATKVLFEKNISLFDYFESDFNKEVAKIYARFQTIDDNMRQGEHKKTRDILSDVDHILNTLITNNNFYLYLYSKLNNEITTVFEDMKNKYALLLDSNINEDVYMFKKQINDTEEEIKSIILKTKEIQYNAAITGDIENNLKDRIEDIENNMDLIIRDLARELEFKDEIKSITSENAELIKSNTELIEDLQNEQTEIKRKYKIDSFEEITTLEEDIIVFDQFLDDYEKLMMFVEKGERKYSEIITDIKKSNAYIIRLNNKIYKVGKQLEAIRQEELNALSNIEKFENDLVKINAFKIYNDFGHVDSGFIKELENDILIKIKDLKTELNQESLEISRISMLNKSIEELIKNLSYSTKKEIEMKNIIEDIIIYMDQSNVEKNSKELENYSMKIKSMCKDYKYEQAYNELQSFLGSNSRGKNFFKSVVEKSKILSVDEFYG